jgi:recombination protein RecR
MRYPPSLARLIEELKKLPGIGQKNAQRLAFHLLKVQSDRAESLADALVEMKKRIRHCSCCFNLTEVEVCSICSDQERKKDLICVVQSPWELIAIEATGQFRGRYHVLMGVLSPMKGIGPEELKVRELLERLRDDDIEEVIIATNLDVEGEATASYLAGVLKSLGIRTSRIAKGIPVGGTLENADHLTLGMALEGRHDL